MALIAPKSADMARHGPSLRQGPPRRARSRLAGRERHEVTSGAGIAEKRPLFGQKTGNPRSGGKKAAFWAKNRKSPLWRKNTSFFCKISRHSVNKSALANAP
jgi:hypothetical protein